MCLGAIYWARPSRVYFAASHEDAAAAASTTPSSTGRFRIPPPERSIPMIHVEEEQAARPFQEWIAKGDRTEY